MNADAMGVQQQDSFWTGARRPQRQPRGPGGGPAARILVMESLRARGQALRERLVQERFDVGLVEDVRTALRWLAEGLVAGQGPEPELLICNARMLGEAGLRLLSRWREAHPRVPVLFLSAFESAKLRTRLARLPGCLLFEQSFALEEVCATALSQVESYATSQAPSVG